jgi:cytochrome c oxidase subunit 2
VTHGIVDTVREVDQTFLFIFAIAAALLLLITAWMVIVLIRYHHARHPKPAGFKDNMLAEVIWIVAPSLIVLAMFVSGWKSYLALQRAPANALEVQVMARKWSWTFTYPNGRTSGILYVPVNQAVLLSMTSADVLHSFYAPAFRIKRDTVPGMTTRLWFRSGKEGNYDVMCAEYCGLGHSVMHTRIAALSAEDFERWYKGGDAPRGEEPGRELYVKHGCIGCHPLEGLQGVGPSLAGLYGSKRAVTTNRGERTVVADEAYVRRGILQPKAEILKGYAPIMPSYQGQIPPKELDMLMVYLASLSGEKK